FVRRCDLRGMNAALAGKPESPRRFRLCSKTRHVLNRRKGAVVEWKITFRGGQPDRKLDCGGGYGVAAIYPERLEEIAETELQADETSVARRNFRRQPDGTRCFNIGEDADAVLESALCLKVRNQRGD